MASVDDRLRCEALDLLTELQDCRANSRDSWRREMTAVRRCRLFQVFGNLNGLPAAILEGAPPDRTPGAPVSAPSGEDDLPPGLEKLVARARKRLELPPRTADGAGMDVVVEHQGERYSLVIDAVGEREGGGGEDGPCKRY